MVGFHVSSLYADGHLNIGANIRRSIYLVFVVLLFRFTFF